MALQIKVGIIGGSGLGDSASGFFTTDKTEAVDTPFGKPSGILKHGTISGISCVLIARHGSDHSIMPTNVNFRANLYALRKAGCTHVLAATACGSLREQMKPGDFVIIDTFIDRTTKRQQTFYDGSCEEFRGILHIPMKDPFCNHTRKLLMEACTEVMPQDNFHSKGTMVTIEGPRFSSAAESNMFRILGGDVINMTTVPEVVVAKELGLCYASLAMVTDYDCWRESDEGVSVEKVMQCMSNNAANAKKVLEKTVQLIAKKDWTDVIKENNESLAMNVVLPQK